MGGFAGGDEAGYWEDSKIFSVNSLSKTSKISSFQKKTTMEFRSSAKGSFTIEGLDIYEIQSHIFYRALQELMSLVQDDEIEDFVSQHTLILQKDSEDVMEFLCLLREECLLLLSNEELEDIIAKIS